MPESPTKIQSDEFLLLSKPKPKTKKRVYTKYIPPLKDSTRLLNNKTFVKPNSKDDISPVYKVTSKPKANFSDDESNDLVIRRDLAFDINEYERGTKLDDYDSIKFDAVKTVIGDNERSIIALLKFVVTTDLKEFSILKEGKTIFKVNLLKEAHHICFTPTKLFILFQEPLEIEGIVSNSLFIYVGKTNMQNLNEAWGQLTPIKKNKSALFDVMNLQELQRLLNKYRLLNLAALNGNSTTTPLSTPSNTTISTPKSTSSLQNKAFTSLQRKSTRLNSLSRPLHSLGKPSRINTPKNTLTNTASKILLPSEPKNFYGSSPYTPIRQTRSCTRNPTPDANLSTESILIDDPDRPPARRGAKREAFKPSLVYRFHDNSSYKIRNVDFQCLYRGQWINDTLIDFFLKMFAEETFENGQFKRDDLHIFTTFFFTKLKSTPQYYENIERWVSKIDFSNKKYIILPINENLHWYCSIIVGFDKILQKDDTKSKCVIYVFDSLRQEHKNILKPLRTFLINYGKDKFDVEIDPNRIQLKPSAVPKQPNFNDCGVHVMYNVYRFLEDPETCLNIWNTENDASRHVLSSFFKKKDREDMREKLRKILKRLQSEQEHRDDDSDKEDTNAEDEDEDDIVYIDADEFNELKNKTRETKENSAESEQSENKNASEEPKLNQGEEGDKSKTPEENDNELPAVEKEEKAQDDEGERFFSSQEENDKDTIEPGKAVEGSPAVKSPIVDTDSAKPLKEDLIENDTQVDTQADSYDKFQDDSQATSQKQEQVQDDDIVQIKSFDSQESVKAGYEEVPATQETQEDQKMEHDNELEVSSLDNGKISTTQEQPTTEDIKSSELIEESQDVSQDDEKKDEIVSSLIETFEEKKEPEEEVVHEAKIDSPKPPRESSIEVNEKAVEVLDEDEDENGKSNHVNESRTYLYSEPSSPLTDVPPAESPLPVEESEDEDIIMNDGEQSMDIKKFASKYFSQKQQSSDEFDMNIPDSSQSNNNESLRKPSRVIHIKRGKSKLSDHELIDVDKESSVEIASSDEVSTGKNSSFNRSSGPRAGTGPRKRGGRGHRGRGNHGRGRGGHNVGRGGFAGRQRVQNPEREVVNVEDEPNDKEDSTEGRPSRRTRLRGH